MTDDKLIEAMARALAAQDGGDDWRIYESDAQAALAAHAEWMKAEGKCIVPEVPTEAMEVAGRENAHFFPADDVADIYSAMIAAAKGEA